ncbi:MAG TPA: hypothetical protein VKV06_05880, partial [Acidimicrobiales bacterium]|nr:hypothetical protein [Acidimicrobiales bacterium]
GWVGGAGVSQAAAPPARLDLQAGFYGLNYDYAGAAEFNAEPVDPLLKDLEPGTLRWPGGTGADFFDWHTGKPTQNAQSFQFWLTALERAHRATGAAPIFDLNVLAHPDSTADQLSMLSRARSLGLPIKYVEIGNELYGGGPNGQFARVFKNGTQYGETVARYVRALHAKFPGVKVAADAVLHGDTAREKAWNGPMLKAATGSGAPDAIIFHDYPGVTYNPFTLADVPTLMEGPYKAIAQIDRADAKIGGRTIWLTEYNFRGPYVSKKPPKPDPVTTSYAHELYLAELALMLPRIDHIARVDNWTALDGSAFGAWINPAKPQLSPGGQAIAMIEVAANGATTTSPVTISGAPTLPDGDPAIAGQAFFGQGGATTELLVNLSGEGKEVPVEGGVPVGAPVQRVSGNPVAQQTVATPLTTLKVTSGHVWLPKYSVTLVGTTIG